MRRSEFLLGGAGLAITSLTSEVAPQEVREPRLMGIWLPVTPEDYRATPYLRAANALQQIGSERAIEQLRRSILDYERKPLGLMAMSQGVILLARMLFVPRSGRTLRRPALGAANFLAGTAYADWPDEPLTIVDGVPFLILEGYTLGGRAEFGLDYLDYCVSEGQWNPHRFRLRTGTELCESARKLITAGPWKRPLAAWEQRFIERQVA